MKKYVIYKTTNKVNGKVYIGFHSIDENQIISEFMDGGSIFSDGYLGSGKLIRRAVKRYGECNFTQELVFESFSRKDAEDKEAEIVNAEFTLREDTYNIAIGGNVRIFHGENNPFYGKKHSPEVLEKLSASSKGNKYFSNAKDNRIMVVSTGEIFLDYVELKKAGYVKSKRQMFRGVHRGVFRYLSEDKQANVLKMCERWMSDEDKKALLAELCRERFRGKNVLTEESRKKLSSSLKKWIESNPEKHHERMMKINKNPEKIKKMADKHRGMKRSEQTRKNISESLKGKPSHAKGRVMAYDPSAENKKTTYFNSKKEVPDGWIIGAATKGKKRGKSYTDGKIYKIFLNEEDVPPGWYRKGPPKKKVE